MNRYILMLCLAAGACTPAARSGGDQPRPADSAQLRLIGDYYSAGDTLYVREQNGALEGVLKRSPSPLTQVRGDTFRLGGRRVVFTETAARLDDVVFDRRPVAAGTFRITPRRPIEELRRDALAATPPPQADSLLPSDLVEVRTLDPGIKYDIRYASTNNFMGAVFYSSSHAFLQRPAAEAVARAHRKLAQHGYGLLIHDAYRPWYVTKMFWDATPDSLRDFVADPAAGSRHNRGAAVDLTLYDLKTGEPIRMPSGYDEFSERAFPNYPGGTTEQRRLRDLLRRVMEEEGFNVYEFEWWHFDYGNWRRYRIGTATFEELLAK
jgi:D-alanyl-D-alanine dipeptidase